MLRLSVIAMIATALIMNQSGEVMAGGACFKGKALPECHAFWITEAGALYRFHKTKTHHKWYETLMYNWELGFMFNRSRYYAIGGGLFADFDDYSNNIQMGFRPRYRRWLFRGISLDIAPGLILTGSKIETPALSGLAMVNIRDYAALMLRFDVINGRAMGYGGIRFCSYPGVITAIAGPIIAFLIWDGFNGGYDDRMLW